MKRERATVANLEPHDLNVQRLPGVLARYRDPMLSRSLIEIAITALPLITLWVAMWGLMHISYWLSLILSIPAAGFLVRLFLIQHDCSHGSFFRHRVINDWVGRAIGVVTLTPYDYWKSTHAATTRLRGTSIDVAWGISIR